MPGQEKSAPGLVDAIDGLCEQATELGQQSDKLNWLIDYTNTRLSGAGVGIITWVAEEVCKDEEDEPVHLGWTRLSGKLGWRLALFNLTEDEYGRTRAASNAMSLRAAPQALRAKAITHLPQLLSNLTHLVGERRTVFEPIQSILARAPEPPHALVVNI